MRRGVHGLSAVLANIAVCSTSAVLLAACVTPHAATPTAKPSSPSAPVPAAAQPSATHIVSETLAGYEKATSYVDHGTVATIFKTYSGERTQSKSFNTAFVRGRAFRFEYRDGDDAKRAYVIWSDGKNSYTQWYLHADITDDGDDLSVPLGAAAGVSSSTSENVPLLLMPEFGSSILAELGDLHFDRDEDVGGHKSWHVVGVQWRGDPIEIWIDQTTRLIRRIQTRHHFGPETRGGEFDTVETIEYEPLANTTIDPALLKPPDLSTGVVKREHPPWIGIRPDMATARVRHVVPGGPAEQAGVKAGDEIVSVDGHAVSDGRSIVSRSLKLQAGIGVPIVVRRDGIEQTLTLVPAKRPRPARKVSNPVLNKPAADVSFVDMAGSSVRLASLRGQVVVLEFWATWCGPCEALAPQLDAIQHKYARAGLRVFGVSNESVSTIQSYATAKQLSYAMASDPNDDVSDAFHIEGLPTVVIVDKRGTVRYVGRGVSAADPLLANLLR